MHAQDTDEGMVIQALTDVNIFDSLLTNLIGHWQPNSGRYIMGRRNWCGVWWDQKSQNLIFDIRVETQKGIGEIVGSVQV